MRLEGRTFRLLWEKEKFTLFHAETICEWGTFFRNVDGNCYNEGASTPSHAYRGFYKTMVSFSVRLSCLEGEMEEKEWRKAAICTSFKAS
ncbi:unnamed protein product [Sphenostylis stenocarpa]|uniref:Uncharacterized protein n=1 Tax=Sphenostylis stenocarpa TaxID=92480 RepID=A0AA86RTN3_9FABA|nr:unnamed protein product [Sphenostylis stenocarpa]